MAYLPIDEVRQTRDALRYGFAVGRARALERRALDPAAFERLLDASGFAEQMRLLSDTPYGRYLEGATTPADVERGLGEALDAFYRFLADLPEPVADYFRVRYDFGNLKAALKAKVLGVPLEGLMTGHGSVEPARFAGDLTALPEPLAGVAEQVLAQAPAEQSADAERDRVSPAEVDSAPDLAAIDHAVDAAMFARLHQLASKARSTFLRDVTSLAVDLANVKVVVRSRLAARDAAWATSQLIEGGSVPLGEFEAMVGLEPDRFAEKLRRYPALRAIPTSLVADAATLDVATDVVTQAALERARRGPVGPEPVIAYVFGRESEVTALRALLLGTLSGVNRETLRARLRPGL